MSGPLPAGKPAQLQVQSWCFALPAPPLWGCRIHPSVPGFPGGSELRSHLFQSLPDNSVVNIPLISRQLEGKKKKIPHLSTAREQEVQGLPGEQQGQALLRAPALSEPSDKGCNSSIPALPVLPGWEMLHTPRNQLWRELLAQGGMPWPQGWNKSSDGGSQ